ncbi:uncharacterized protein LOC126903589 [Daktulosphaira vitifoliae]|uniref:uncharacterized protein LOC126903589 n=1 Tax=Daktulosphaira vitifoliae TaxID=58002 RepID=UPI0021AA327F|nr:uncharacterized protein LOC126903589 [Daktulosphaira vitifoliae]XP_050537780.1 uncharacterized protein LOC126903589 [Daktulosphaira vitifoliae]
MNPDSDDNRMIIGEPLANINKLKTSENMNISVAFKEIVNKNSPKFTELCDVVNNTFDGIVNCVSLEEFKHLLCEISFLKNKNNVTRLFSTLKTNIYSTMNKQFEEITQDENLAELFSNKKSLTEMEAEKYVIDDDSLEIIALEESLSKLDKKINELEETNEILFNQGKFNKQCYNQLVDRIDNLMKNCETKYGDFEQQTDLIRKEFANLLKDI